jgi:hypothetical protein
MKTLKNYLYISVALVLLAGCKPSFENPKGTKGTADFTRYIAVGNSLTAGYADGGLYLEGQQNSYPSIIAKQMALVGGGKFTQPLFTEAQANGSGYIKLMGFTPTGSPITASYRKYCCTRQVNIPGFGNVLLYDQIHRRHQ